MINIIKKSPLFHSGIKNHSSFMNIYAVYVTIQLLIIFRGTGL